MSDHHYFDDPTPHDVHPAYTSEQYLAMNDAFIKAMALEGYVPSEPVVNASVLVRVPARVDRPPTNVLTVSHLANG